MKNISTNSKEETLSLGEITERKVTSITVSYTALKKELYTGVLSFLNLFSTKRLTKEEAIFTASGVMLLRLDTDEVGSIHFLSRNNDFPQKFFDLCDKNTLRIFGYNDPNIKGEIHFLLENIVQIDWT